MKLRDVLSSANDLWRRLRTRKKRKLYHQWVEEADLPSEAVPQEDVGLPVIPEEAEPAKQPLRPHILYLLLGGCLVMLCAIFILLLFQSC